MCQKAFSISLPVKGSSQRFDTIKSLQDPSADALPRKSSDEGAVEPALESYGAHRFFGFFLSGDAATYT